MSKTIEIFCKNTQTYHVLPMGISLKEFYDSVLKGGVPNVIVAKVNNATVGLDYELYKSKQIEYVGYNTDSGLRAYVRTLSFLISSAVEELYPGKKFFVEHPVSNGLYCRLELGRPLRVEDIECIKGRVIEFIRADNEIRFGRKETSKVIEMFKERGRQDIVNLLETRGDLYSGYYKMGWHIDYYYSSLAYSAGFVKDFDLLPYYEGMLMRIPDMDDVSKLQPVIKQDKMMSVFAEFLKWSDIMDLANVGDLNKRCIKGDSTMLINIAESLQEKKLSKIADDIASRKKIKIILISGPSSSGKTTFSKKLMIHLMVNGLKPVSISLDDYFVDRVNTPLDDSGEYDFESLYALDIDLFKSNLIDLIAGKEIERPRFDFNTGVKEFSGEKMKLEENTIIIIEGIHALNPDLIGKIDNNVTYKIFASALTAMSLDEHNWIPPEDNRLIRRIIRDYRYRGYSARETISRWESVRDGEEKWIKPYQENADAMFNTSLLFEFSVLRTYIEPILSQVPQCCGEYAEAKRLLRFIKYFVPIPNRDIPRSSLLREFFGGSSFKY